MGWFAPALSGSNTLLPASPLMYPGNDHPGNLKLLLFGLILGENKTWRHQKWEAQPHVLHVSHVCYTGTFEPQGFGEHLLPREQQLILAHLSPESKQMRQGRWTWVWVLCCCLFFQPALKDKKFCKETRNSQIQSGCRKEKKIFLYFMEFNPRIIFVYTSIM